MRRFNLCITHLSSDFSHQRENPDLTVFTKILVVMAPISEKRLVDPL